MPDSHQAKTLIRQSATPASAKKAAKAEPIAAPREPPRKAEPKPSVPLSTNKPKDPVAPNSPAQTPAATNEETAKGTVDAPRGREADINSVEVDGYESDPYEIDEDESTVLSLLMKTILNADDINYIEILDTPPSSLGTPSSNVPTTSSAGSSQSLKRKAPFSHNFFDEEAKFWEAEELEERKFKRVRASWRSIK
ncbi:hypothetical protein C8F04DRAFT_1189692 [Mycena alexandri]|uniref:Uncharacterized protein n=1 Tax=Mycena alexandri TaxID=1745969 RepID=A0AAD6SGV8_9AGAR|nr:hypothetical protein C8F04DRAFT_1189692 [Mycena alexandri]